MTQFWLKYLIWVLIFWHDFGFRNQIRVSLFVTQALGSEINLGIHSLWQVSDSKIIFGFRSLTWLWVQKSNFCFHSLWNDFRFRNQIRVSLYDKIFTQKSNLVSDLYDIIFGIRNQIKLGLTLYDMIKCSRIKLGFHSLCHWF